MTAQTTKAAMCFFMFILWSQRGGDGLMMKRSGISNTVHRLVGAAMARIAKRRPGRSRLVYDRSTRTIRVRGMHGEDKGDSGLHTHDW